MMLPEYMCAYSECLWACLTHPIIICTATCMYVRVVMCMFVFSGSTILFPVTYIGVYNCQSLTQTNIYLLFVYSNKCLLCPQNNTKRNHARYITQQCMSHFITIISSIVPVTGIWHPSGTAAANKQRYTHCCTQVSPVHWILWHGAAGVVSTERRKGQDQEAHPGLQPGCVWWITQM